VGRFLLELDSRGPVTVRIHRRTKPEQTKGRWLGKTTLADEIIDEGRSVSIDIARTAADRDTQIEIVITPAESVNGVALLADGNGYERGRIEQIRDGKPVIRLDPIGKAEVIR
jgi:hypothetical protein